MIVCFRLWETYRIVAMERLVGESLGPAVTLGLMTTSSIPLIPPLLQVRTCDNMLSLLSFLSYEEILISLAGAP